MGWISPPFPGATCEPHNRTMTVIALSKVQA
jgi:hypothetical protein